MDYYLLKVKQLLLFYKEKTMMDNSLSKDSICDNQDEEFVNIELKSCKSSATDSEFNKSKLDNSQKGTLKKKSVREFFSVFTLFKKRKDANENNKDEILSSPEKDKASTLESTISPSVKETSRKTTKKRGASNDNSSLKKETFNDLIEKGNTHFQQGDYEEAANSYRASLIVDPKSERNFHKKMSSIYAELAALDLDRHSYNAQGKKVKQEIIEEKNKYGINLSNDKFQTFLSKLSMQQIKYIAMDFSRYAYAIQKQFADYKKIKDLRKHYIYTVIRFERIQTAFGIVVTAHIIDRNSKYEVVILPNCFIQSLNRFVINNYNQYMSGKKLQMIYKGTDKFGEKLVFKV